MISGVDKCFINYYLFDKATWMYYIEENASYY